MKRSILLILISFAIFSCNNDDLSDIELGPEGARYVPTGYDSTEFSPKQREVVDQRLAAAIGRQLFIEVN